MNAYPLIVDLDGTLLNTDMLHESALKVFRDNPVNGFRIPFWLCKGKAILKRNLANRFSFDPALLPYNIELLEWLKMQRANGRKLVLCTASDQLFAELIAAHLGLFEEVIGSNGLNNLSGKRKADILEKRFGRSGFDYVGNSSADLLVWKFARCGIVVNASKNLANQAARVCSVEAVFPKHKFAIRTWFKVFRVHQWLKNLLIFVPLFAAHELANGSAWLSLVLAFISFSLCASCVYIANDLFDLESDRIHPRKRLRPFASGLVSLATGVILAPLLFVGSLVIGSYVGSSFLYWLVCYSALTCAYSWGLKRVILADCLTLSLLYTLRIIAGAAAVGQALSFWLLAFSVFLFLSLAFVKRYSELEVQLKSGREKIHGRGYLTSDAPLIQTMGITSGYVASLILALYINSDAVSKLYREPYWVWGAVPVMIFWTSWMWMQAHRGKMHDDPLVFAVKDRTSLAAGVVFALFLMAGTVGIQW